ncbi:fructose bisphosphate aldolase [Acidipropionibacterium virtanenii]|uniref:fructose-bisphosphate aldolase n=1 Tax=Acidipropionibacterium virtanenii TaxID=2057246 RepID=A0A344UWS6_9ACTN|nr:fructose bisphosphate aldolase [Acidipropionibacterium virtanenii]AXE39724.1 Fructose-bisphosphate aldolase class 1 [Acidipropionibacterium virtanenii]
MNTQQLDRMHSAPGFIAALDQSGGSTPKALRAYGIEEDAYGDDKDKMFDLVHEMRTRIITSPSFTAAHILAGILFEQTMDREIEGVPTADYLWERKGIVPILKIDKGLEDAADHVRVMKPIPGLDETLARARDEKHIFGTKARSVILDADEAGIARNVDQQFEIGDHVRAAGLVPILEPEVDIHAPNKQQAEDILHSRLRRNIDALPDDARIMLKLTPPTTDDFYADFIADPKVVRVAALSGGYSRHDADEILMRNHGLIASFSRALSEGLSVDQSDEDFDATLASSIAEIYQASIS